MILVTGATGYIGGEVVRRLSASGLPVRALVRSLERAEWMRELDGVEVVRGDLSEPGTLEAPLRDVEAAFLLSAAGPEQAKMQGNFVEASRRAGLGHVVKLSAAGADPASPVEVARWHAETEGQIVESGLAHTFLRPNFFMQNFDRYFAQTIVSEGAFSLPAGDGAAAMIDTRDVAAAAAVVLASPEDHEGEAYYLTGPEPVSFADAARELSAATGRPVRYRDVPPEEYGEAMLRAGEPEWLVNEFVQMGEAISRGFTAETSGTVREITGEAPTPFARYARDHAGAFRGADDEETDEGEVRTA
jgi:uncharacterized protein YbjT (DUF2867 family)